MAVKPDFSEKLGLDWLRKSPSQNQSAPVGGPDLPPVNIPAANVPVDAARAMVGKQILGVLKTSPNKSESVYKIVDRLQLDISTVLSVSEYLEATGFIRMDKDNYGNHTLHLTDAGEAWIA